MIYNERNIQKQNYTERKYDLEEVLIPLYKYKQKYFEWCEDHNNEDYSLTYLLDCIKASFLAPAYNYNKLTDEIVQDVFWDEIKYEVLDEQRVSMGMRSSQIIIEVQNCLISIKIALDRIVKLFRLYKRGIAEYSTFGHINLDTNKTKGFMSLVAQDKDKDDILRYVYQEYHKWIRGSVQARDTIIHYDDIQVIYSFSNMCEVPIFSCVKKEDVIEFSFEDITSYINSFYILVEELIRMIFDKITDVGE